MNATQIAAALTGAQQTAALVEALTAPFLAANPGAAAAVRLATATLGLAADAIREQRDIDSISWAQLDLEEVQILAADAKAQEEAIPGRLMGDD